MIQLVIINGHSGSGKDTFVELVQKHIYGFTTDHLHSSDSAKKALESLGWNGEKTPEIRELLAKLTDLSQQSGLSEKSIEKSSKDIVFFHERDPQEIKILKRIFPNVTTVLVERPTQLQREPDRWGLESYRYDYIVLNVSDLEELDSKADKFANILMDIVRGNKSVGIEKGQKV